MPEKPYGIVGFDPGNTCAIGIVDFSGNVVFVKSFKGASPEECIRLIGDSCVPAVFASDVFPVQGATRKLAGAFSCRTWSPEISLGVVEKREAISGRKLDVHERDALAAALFCFNSYSGLFERARKRAGPLWPGRAFRILKGSLPNLSSEEKEELEKIDGKRGPGIPLHLKLRLLAERNAFLEGAIRRIRARNSELEGLADKKTRNGAAVVIEKVFVKNREKVHELSAESELARRVLSSLVGKEVHILRVGAAHAGCIYVKDCGLLRAEDVFRQGIKVIVCETGVSSLPCKILRIGGQSIFNGEFALVERELLAVERETEKAWARGYLEFVSR